jgi:hypothetical protein
MTNIIHLPEADKDGVTKVTYEGGKFGPHATDRKQIYVELDKPLAEATCSYEVFFPANFDFNRGGKLPGIASNKAISGGNKAIDDYSVRCMWRTNGMGEAYVYVPPALMSKDYKKSCTESNPQYGDSIGRGSFHFKKNAWNKITIYTKLNTPGKDDGVLRVSHDGKTVIDVKCMCYRRDKAVMTRYAMFSTFFGGSTQDWAPKSTQTAKFRNFTVK